MALQSSGAISIDNIRTELGQAQANSSLRSLSALAGKSTPDAMSEFYGYSNVTSTAIFLVETGVEDQGAVCEHGGGEFQVYWSGSGCPTTGATLYNDAALTETFDGKNLWWKSYQCSVGWYIMGNGFIEGQVGC